MKTVLISIQAEHNANIEKGIKTSELRTRIPKCELPIKFFTYESGKNGRHKVTNEWICREIREHPNPDNYSLSLAERACVPFSYICDYAKDGEKLLHELVISDLVIYDKPKELGEFKKPCNHKNDCCTCDRYDYIGHKCYDEITRPPQSYMFVELGV